MASTPLSCCTRRSAKEAEGEKGVGKNGRARLLLDAAHGHDVEFAKPTRACRKGCVVVMACFKKERMEVGVRSLQETLVQLLHRAALVVALRMMGRVAVVGLGILLARLHDEA